MPRATTEPPIYTFRIRILDCFAGYAPEHCREIQREIEIAANQTLSDLADAICRAYGFDDPHLWSFFLSGKRWDTATEYTIRMDDPFSSLIPDASGQAMDDAPPPSARLLRNAALPHVHAFAAAFLPTLPEALRDRMRGFLDVPHDPADAGAATADVALIEAFLAEFEPEFLLAVEETLATVSPAARPAALADLADAVRQDILDTLDDADALGIVADDGAAGETVVTPGIISPFPALPPDLFPPEPALMGDPDETFIRDVPFPGKTGKQEFLFVFDYGDHWEFGVKLLKIAPTKTPRARYPRVTAVRGKAPPQYPPLSWYEDEADGDEPTMGITLGVDPTTGMMMPRLIAFPRLPSEPPGSRKKTPPAPEDMP